MPTITALLHTHNDALRLGRCLETLYPCDEILILDHGSTDDTISIAREYGARVISAGAQAPPDFRSRLADRAWILCLDPRESLTESLAATLYEWKLTHTRWPSAFSVLIREETAQGWSALSAPETRLVPPDWNRWSGNLPAGDGPAPTLDGELLRFRFP
jgi:glycosyltransferase involved in cell wall biosynthesis